MISTEDHDGQHDGKNSYGSILAGEEGFGAFPDGVRDDAHLGGAGVGRKYDACEYKRGDKCEHANAESDP